MYLKYYYYTYLDASFSSSILFEIGAVMFRDKSHFLSNNITLAHHFTRNNWNTQFHVMVCINVFYFMFSIEAPKYVYYTFQFRLRSESVLNAKLRD